MLKKLASDALGLSDIGKIISPNDYDKVQADDYIMHEDGEKIFFLIKSKTDEYCFTNIALIHVDGASAVSSKRLVKRYEYYANQIGNVFLETAGNVDLDVEIKFSIGNLNYSIDVDKKQIEQLKDLYKALIKISQISRQNIIELEFSKQSLNIAQSVTSPVRIEGESLSQEFKNINEYAFKWFIDNRNKYVVKDFGDVFKKYIEN